MATSGRTPTRQGLQTRQRIAELCASEPQTAAELAAALGRKDGAVRTVLGAMVGEGHLRAAAREDARGGAWQLTAPGRRALLTPQRRRAPGVMTAGTRLVLIGERSVGLPVQALREAARLPSFRWAATLHGGARFVAALDDDVDAERLRQAVAAAGGDTALSIVSDLMDAVELTRYLDAVAGPATRELEVGS